MSIELYGYPKKKRIVNYKKYLIFYVKSTYFLNKFNLFFSQAFMLNKITEL